MMAGITLSLVLSWTDDQKCEVILTLLTGTNDAAIMSSPIEEVTITMASANNNTAKQQDVSFKFQPEASAAFCFPPPSLSPRLASPTYKGETGADPELADPACGEITVASPLPPTGETPPTGRHFDLWGYSCR